MDPEAKEVFSYLVQFFPWITTFVLVSVGGWVFTTWIRISDHPSKLAREIGALGIDKGGHA